MTDCSRTLQRHLISRVDAVADLAKLRDVVRIWRRKEDELSRERKNGLADLVQRASIEVKELVALYILATEGIDETEWRTEISREAEPQFPLGYDNFFGRLEKGAKLLVDMI